MRNTLVLSVRGSFGPDAPGEPAPQPPPTTADADAGPLAASHMPDTEADAVMPSAPNLNTVPPAADDPRRRGPSAEAGGDEMVGDEMDGDSIAVRRAGHGTAATTSTAMASFAVIHVSCRSHRVVSRRETRAQTSTVGGGGLRARTRTRERTTADRLTTGAAPFGRAAVGLARGRVPRAACGVAVRRHHKYRTLFAAFYTARIMFDIVGRVIQSNDFTIINLQVFRVLEITLFRSECDKLFTFDSIVCLLRLSLSFIRCNVQLQCNIEIIDFPFNMLLYLFSLGLLCVSPRADCFSRFCILYILDLMSGTSFFS